MRLFISGPELVDEVCDDARFDKKVTGGLANVGEDGSSAGLFTAETQDPLWQRAHSILLSPFSLQAMRDYMPKMLDVAEQLMDKWSRLNPGEAVDVPADMTRLTLDTIALCGFGYRFNSFYRDSQHPFVEAMLRTLAESQTQARQLPIQTRLRVRAARQREEDDAFMNDLVDRLIAERRAQGDAADTTDLLGRMLTGVDKQTGEGLPDHNIRAQCITFLVAGHETTSGLLSFATYYLLKNPEVLARARAEVDQVLGGSAAPTHRAGAAADLRATDPRRVASAVADRARLHPPAVRGHRARRAVRRPRRHPDHHADPGAAPRARRCGAPTPRSSTRTGWRRRSWPRSRRTRTSRSAPGSGPASAGSSRCRRPPWCWAWCCSASNWSTTSTTS